MYVMVIVAVMAGSCSLVHADEEDTGMAGVKIDISKKQKSSVVLEWDYKTTKLKHDSELWFGVSLCKMVGSKCKEVPKEDARLRGESLGDGKRGMSMTSSTTLTKIHAKMTLDNLEAGTTYRVKVVPLVKSKRTGKFKPYHSSESEQFRTK